MRKPPRPDNYNLALLDMLFAMCLAYVMLFMISLLMIKPATKPEDSNVKLQAQFIITMTWPDDTLDDVDMWVQLPDSRKVWFQQPNVGWAVLERDDTGGVGDVRATSPTDPTPIWLKLNKELVTIRANTPGRYVVAAHLFKIHKEVLGVQSLRSVPYEAKIEVTKLNPVVKVVATASVPLTKVNDRAAAIAFTLDADGNVIDVELNPADDIVMLQPQYSWSGTGIGSGHER